MNLHSLFENVSEEKCPHCNGPMFSELMINEKKDACYYKVKSRYKVWPSAYASGALVKCRKKGADSWGNKSESVAEEATGDEKCPPATQDIKLNLKNRQKAIDQYGYGPLNPDLPNNKFWMKKVDEWNLDSVDEAKQSLCGNCAAFDQRQYTLDCIAQGIGSEQGSEDPTIEAGELGYCRFLKFKCASRRTCDAWVTGGPLVDTEDQLDENLHDWFHKEKWVRFGPDGKIRGDCARGSESEGKPKCLPQAKAHALGKKGRASAAARKRKEDPNPERRGPAHNVATKSEGVAEGSLNEGQYEMMMRNGQVKKFIAKDDADAKRIAAGHGAKSVIKLRGGVPAGKVEEQGVAEAQTDYQKRRQRERDVDAGKPAKPPPKNPQNDYFARRKKERDLAEDQAVQLSPNISARPNQDPDSPEDYDYFYKDMQVMPGQDFHTQIKDQHLRQMDPAYNTMRTAFDNPIKPGTATPYKEPKGDTIIPVRPQEPEKMKDIEGNPVRLRDYVPGDPRISESRLYYRVIGTADKDLRSDFGLRKDKNGWYLKESSSPKYKMMAQRAFGSPKLQEYNFPAGQATKGSEGVISPVGSVPRNQINKK